MRSMSRRAWRIRTKSRWQRPRSTWWLYLVTLAVLLWAGVKAAIWGQGVLPGGLGWIAWIVFAGWWIPTSLGISKWLAAGIGQLFALPARLLSLAERPSSERIVRATKLLHCPHCGKEVEADGAICPHCYQDLKTNCPGCGAILSVTSKECARCGAPLPQTNEARR